VKPIYSGTYQDTITKALTAVKGGEPPVTSILLSTDMFHADRRGMRSSRSTI